MIRLIFLFLLFTIPVISFAGGALRGLSVLYEVPIFVTLFLPLLFGGIVCLFYPTKRWKVFKQVALTTFIILLVITILFLTYIFSK